MQSLGDIADPEAYVGARVRRKFPSVSTAEHEELVGAGLAYIGEVAAKAHGPSLEATVRIRLEDRLVDAWRKLHPEYRRNTRSGTATMLPSPTGLAHENAIGDAAAGLGGALDEEARIESRLALVAFNSPRDLRNPERIAQLLETLGLPSHAPPGSAAAVKIDAEIKAEREEFSERVPFSHKPFEL